MLAIVKEVGLNWLLLTLAGNLAGRMWQVGDHFMAVAIALAALCWVFRWLWRDGRLPAGQSS